MILSITPAGTTKCLYTEELALDELGSSTIQRASVVEPEPQGWYARIVGGPLLGPFAKRSEAIRAEILYLEENVL